MSRPVNSITLASMMVFSKLWAGLQVLTLMSLQRPALEILCMFLSPFCYLSSTRSPFCPLLNFSTGHVNGSLTLCQ